MPYYSNTKKGDEEVKERMRDQHRNTKYSNYSIENLHKDGGQNSNYNRNGMDNFDSFSRQNHNSRYIVDSQNRDVIRDNSLHNINVNRERDIRNQERKLQ